MPPTSPEYLQSTYYLDYDTPDVGRFAEDNCDSQAPSRTKAVQLYYAVRDHILYDPYDLRYDPTALRASRVLRKGSGYCVAKAVLLAALARHQSIPARLGFADVTNHLSTPRLRRIMKTNLFIYHGYTEMLIEGTWVKATPAFNLSLCTRFNVKPLDFDGTCDSLFHPYDAKGQKHMEYVHDHGHFADLPFERIFQAYDEHYPGMLDTFGKDHHDFFREAKENRSDTSS